MLNLILFNRFDIDDCEVDDSEGEDDEVNGNDGDGDGIEDDSEEGYYNKNVQWN